MRCKCGSTLKKGRNVCFTCSGGRNKFCIINSCKNPATGGLCSHHIYKERNSILRAESNYDKFCEFIAGKD